MFNLKTIPIAYSNWDEGSGWFQAIYYNGYFREDFLPFKKGERFDKLIVDFENGTLWLYKGNDLHITKWTGVGLV